MNKYLDNYKKFDKNNIRPDLVPYSKLNSLYRNIISKNSPFNEILHKKELQNFTKYLNIEEPDFFIS